jgi:phosphoenolpyruvate carboxykinase (ATP)
VEPKGLVYWNLEPREFYQHAARRNEGRIISDGPFIAITTPHTGRSPKDKFVVREPTTEAEVWWGPVNQPMSPQHYELLDRDIRE